jgi:hypothetical protein
MTEPSRRRILCTAELSSCGNAQNHPREATLYCVEMRSLLVATIQRLPVTSGIAPLDVEIGGQALPTLSR